MMAALSSLSPTNSSANGTREWDLTHLSAKYPWLRVDAETIEEFRSPFQWIDVPLRSRSHQLQAKQRVGGASERAGSAGARYEAEGGSQSVGEERDESVNFTLSEKRTSKPRDERAKKQRSQRRRSPPSSRQMLPSFRRAGADKQTSTSSQPATKCLQRGAQKCEPPANVSFPSDRDPPEKVARRAFEEPTEPSSLLISLQREDPLYQAVMFPAKSRRKLQPRKPKKRHNILTLRCVCACMRELRVAMANHVDVHFRR